MAKPDPKESKDKDAASPGDKAGAGAGAGDKGGAGAGAGAADKKSAIKAWLPAIAAVVLAPAVCFAVSQFVLLPRLQHQLAIQPAAAGAGHEEPVGEEPAEAGGEGAKEGGKEGGKEGAGGPGNYEFSNVVVNLSGTMGTRYLKTSFIVTPADKKGNLKGIFEEHKAKLTDITLNVLSSLTLADLEEPGAKNVIREKLVATYNQALGKRVVDQVYFSDFVVQ